MLPAVKTGDCVIDIAADPVQSLDENRLKVIVLAALFHRSSHERVTPADHQPLLPAMLPWMVDCPEASRRAAPAPADVLLKVPIARATLEVPAGGKAAVPSTRDRLALAEPAMAARANAPIAIEVFILSPQLPLGSDRWLRSPPGVGRTQEKPLVKAYTAPPIVKVLMSNPHEDCDM